MANNQAIQILRGSSSFNPQDSDVTLLEGQPFYSLKDKTLYVGDEKPTDKTKKQSTLAEQTQNRDYFITDSDGVKRTFLVENIKIGDEIGGTTIGESAINTEITLNQDKFLTGDSNLFKNLIGKDVFYGIDKKGDILEIYSPSIDGNGNQTLTAKVIGYTGIKGGGQVNGDVTFAESATFNSSTEFNSSATFNKTTEFKSTVNCYSNLHVGKTSGKLYVNTIASETGGSTGVTITSNVYLDKTLRVNKISNYEGQIIDPDTGETYGEGPIEITSPILGTTGSFSTLKASKIEINSLDNNRDEYISVTPELKMFNSLRFNVDTTNSKIPAKQRGRVHDITGVDNIDANSINALSGSFNGSVVASNFVGCLISSDMAKALF